MTNTKRYKARKRLTAVFLVCTAFVMCSMTSYASGNFIDGTYMNTTEFYNSAVEDMTRVDTSLPVETSKICVYSSQRPFVIGFDNGGMISTYSNDVANEPVVFQSFDLPANVVKCEYYSPASGATLSEVYCYIEFASPVVINWFANVAPGEPMSLATWQGELYAAAPSILDDVGTVTSTVLDVTGSVAQTISNTPLLLLMAVGLPVVSFGTGLLIRIFKRT